MTKAVLLVFTALGVCSASNFTGLPAASNDLGLRLLSFLPRSGAPNVFYSPYSLTAAMGMVYGGCRGSTKEELYNGLGYKSAHIPKKKVMHEHKIFAERFLAPSNSTVNAATAAAIQRRFKVKPEYANTLKKSFGTHLMSVDFEKKSYEATQKINKWVSNETRGHIKKLFKKPLPSSTKLVLLSCVYFKGVWATPFDKLRTKRLPFFNHGKTSILVKTMNGVIRVLYGLSNELASEIVDLPYQGRDYSMTIVLPRAMNGIEKLRHLSQRSFEAALKNLTERAVDIYLPRVEFKAEYHLRGTFIRLGVRRVFDSRKADMSGITGSKGLSLDEVVHKAVVRVDEAGSTAAAVSGMDMKKTITIPRLFHVNHPFLFLIRCTQNNGILFVGEVNKL